MAGLQYNQGQDEQKWGVTFARSSGTIFSLCFLLNLTFKTVKNISVETLKWLWKCGSRPKDWATVIIEAYQSNLHSNLVNTRDFLSLLTTSLFMSAGHDVWQVIPSALNTAL